MSQFIQKISAPAMRAQRMSYPQLNQLRQITASARLGASPPKDNMPPSAKSADRSQPLQEDSQSSASSKDPAESNSGDDHPAKQPDGQQESDRSTGFNESAKEVKGGKQGLGQRTDK